MRFAVACSFARPAARNTSPESAASDRYYPLMPSTIRPPAVSDPPGLKKLGRYECTEQLGADGGFETYRARVKGLTGLDRSFAVKVLRLKRSETPSAVSEPFLQAARRSATLADPHIAKVVEADSSDGLVFAVTPFMEGADLGQFLQRAHEAGARLPPGR